MKSIKYFGAGFLFITIAAAFTACIKEYDNPAKGTPGETSSLFALRQVYRGTEVTLNAETMSGASKIEGIVISDKAGLNIEPGTFVLQQTTPVANTAGDITRGLVIKMAGGTADYTFGDSVRIDVNGAKLDRINGNLTLSGITADKVTILGAGKIPVNRNVTTAMLATLMDQFESTLVSVHADATEYAAGATLAGSKKLNDNTGGVVYASTKATATFANSALPVNAQFNGIAGYFNANAKDTAGAIKVISPRNEADIQFRSGALYAGFPESFETPDASTKTSYNSGTNIVQLATGSWTLLQAILGNTPLSDKFNLPGKQSIRMQQNLSTNGYVQMNFDVPEGASKVTVFYGKYATDAKSTFRLEYSINGGTTWLPVGNNITDMPDKGNKQATWMVNITTPVRFRILKVGTGTSNNGRLSLDDFAIYKKL